MGGCVVCGSGREHVEVSGTLMGVGERALAHFSTAHNQLVYKQLRAVLCAVLCQHQLPAC